MKKPPLALLFCLGVCLLVILGASIGVGVQALRITAKPQSFISLAKLVAGERTAGGSQGVGLPFQEHLKGFYGAIIETIESAEIRRRARDRVRALHPELKECEVEVQASQNKGSAIFNIRAFGTEPKYTRVFLDALLDEFMAFRSAGRIPQTDTASVQIMARASSPVEDLQDWAFPIAIGAVAGGLGGVLLALLISAFIRTATRPTNPPPLPPAS